MEVEEKYYVPSSKINAKISDTVLEGMHIEIGGLTYQRLSRKPRGRSIQRRLLNEKSRVRLVIYRQMYIGYYIMVGCIWAGWLEYFTTKNLEGEFGQPWSWLERLFHTILFPISLGSFIRGMFNTDKDKDEQRRNRCSSRKNSRGSKQNYQRLRR